MNVVNKSAFKEINTQDIGFFCRTIVENQEDQRKFQYYTNMVMRWCYLMAKKEEIVQTTDDQERAIYFKYLENNRLSIIACDKDGSIEHFIVITLLPLTFQIERRI